MSDFLNDLVNVTVTRDTRSVTRVGFGIPLMLAYFSLASWGTARVRAYADLDEMAADGFAPDDPAYRMAQSAFAQENSPSQVKIGRRTRAYTQVISLVPSNPPAVGEVLTLKVDGLTATYTADGTPTRAEACIGLAAAVNALGDADAIVAVSGAHGCPLDSATGGGAGSAASGCGAAGRQQQPPPSPDRCAAGAPGRGTPGQSAAAAPADRCSARLVRRHCGTGSSRAGQRFGGGCFR